uniref:LOW QUALITY PROTEIN: membrane-spanning 4-domains subfamily A member 8-like n=1 Tax=Phascolarctos cinereus TaxID=38626 RepID=A0A6P5JC00_PHACI|nr:LOW QUALITY PROTEIN: membrane-spanning 4-domains subfamily A member 8-like [Phascolarctos cinereus]
MAQEQGINIWTAREQHRCLSSATSCTSVPGNQAQVHLYPGYQIQMIPPYEYEHMAQKIWKEGKVLRAIQIVIGLMHIGFGGVLLTTMFWGYTSISFVGGYPFWGGISFIVSGSLSVSAQKAPGTHCKISGSLGMRTVSAIFSAVGIILFITDLSIYWGNSLYRDPHTTMSTGKGISAMLLLFSILEFAITCTSSHSGCQMVCSQTNQVCPGILSVSGVSDLLLLLVQRAAKRRRSRGAKETTDHPFFSLYFRRL